MNVVDPKFYFNVAYQVFLQTESRLKKHGLIGTKRDKPRMLFTNAKDVARITMHD
jgi:phage terminase small subunit